MKLKEYCNEYCVNKKKFCEKISRILGISVTYHVIWNAYLGKSCTLQTAVGIEKATEGLVTVEDLLVTKKAIKADTKKKNEKKHNSKKNNAIT